MIVTKEFLEQEIQALGAEAESHLAAANQLIGAKIHCQKLLAVLERPETEPAKESAAEEFDEN